MGKSPGRWIKTVLFGKKSSKSNLSKNATLDKKAAAKLPAEDHSPVISADKGTENLELERGSSGPPCDIISSVPVNQGVDSQSTLVLVPVSDAEIRRQNEAAAKAQAAFRGYLARRAFRALKGIIRLQALIRGHLVRRQAVATLHCMQAVVKFQALARGRRVRLSNTGQEVRKICNVSELEDAKQVDIRASSIFGLEKLATFCKLVLSLPNAMPLSLQYDPSEPNSAWNWLERWSLSRFWEPPALPKRVAPAKPQRKQGGSQILENEAGKSKRSIRKASSGDYNNGSVIASLETDKPKRNPRKPVSHQTESFQEQPQNELKRFKRSLRKVSEGKTVISPENPSDPDVVVENKPSLRGAPSDKMINHKLVDESHDDHLPMEPHFSENGEKMESPPFLHEQLSSKEDDSGKENQNIRKRRLSLPAKQQECAENISHSTPSLPSYMAATESAKAKLRAQGSSKLSEDVTGTEQGYVRRHSLPASTNGKLSSLSPRVRKPVQANGKGGSKTNRSMMSLRDDKVLQPGWRR